MSVFDGAATEDRAARAAPPPAAAHRQAPGGRGAHGLAGLVARWEADHGVAAEGPPEPAPTAPHALEQAIERLLLAELDRHALEVRLG